jgi:uncharacterized protein (DUF58 family)
MTIPELARCQSRAMAAAGRLRLPLRSRVWRGQAGEFSGAGTGSSIDFQDHRQYMPGDDPRHINWQAYARTGNYSMKLYREEVRPLVDVVLDSSESMFFDPSKAARTAELFYFLVDSSARTGASVAIHLVRGDITKPIATDEVASHRWFQSARTMNAKDPSAAPDLGRISFRANAIRVFLSDLLFPGDPTAILRALSRSHGSPAIFSPYLKSEADPDWHGNCEFIDIERDSHHMQRVEPAVMRRYRDAYATHFSLWKHAARKHQAAFARIACESELEAALCADALRDGAIEAA